MARRARRGAKRKGAGRRGGASGKVATVATVKRMISRKQETKRMWVGMADFKPGNRRVYATSLFAGLTKGTNSYERIGDTIQDITLNFSIAWTALGLNSLSDTKLQTGSPLRYMVVRTTYDISGVGASGWTQIGVDASTNSALPIFANTVQTVNSLLVPHPDIKVIKQGWVRSETPVTSMIGGTTNFKQFSVKVPRYVYDPIVSANNARRYNYYLCVTSSGGQDYPDNATPGSLQSHFMIQYKDA